MFPQGCGDPNVVACLAPDIGEAILDGRQPKGLRLAVLLRGIPLAWEEQWTTRMG